MCGICGIVGRYNKKVSRVETMANIQHHRGPDATGFYFSSDGIAGLGHNRLSIIDLSDAGRQPMDDSTGRYWLVFNGEIYNYLELRRELMSLGEIFHTQTDSEVLLTSYRHWGIKCLDRFIGMFSFAIWDDSSKTLFAARDRLGVKPFYYSQTEDGSIVFASEIKTIHAAGIERVKDPQTWATYLAYGIYEHSERTFWKNIQSLQPGHALLWQDNSLNLWKWYDLAYHLSEDLDQRSESDVKEEYRSILEESIKLRFRADVPVGINLSGGLDSSILLGLVQTVQGKENSVNAFTFITGDDRYDELPWVRKMLEKTHHPHIVCQLTVDEIPGLAERIQYHQDEPYGGFPTLAYSKIFEKAHELGVKVLLDGQGMDEQWAGYDYYARALGSTVDSEIHTTGPVQGSQSRSVRPECLVPEFLALAEPFNYIKVSPNSLTDLQYRDARFTKIPRALRFNDRISMMHSTELREPFLDHRLFELALKQPQELKIRSGAHKWLLRQIGHNLLPDGLIEAPKRPIQTPQREWLRESLQSWAEDKIENALAMMGGTWLNADRVRSQWRSFLEGEGDNSFYIWQWINMGLVG